MFLTNPQRLVIEYTEKSVPIVIEGVPIQQVPAKQVNTEKPVGNLLVTS